MPAVGTVSLQLTVLRRTLAIAGHATIEMTMRYAHLRLR